MLGDVQLRAKPTKLVNWTLMEAIKVVTNLGLHDLLKSGSKSTQSLSNINEIE